MYSDSTLLECPHCATTKNKVVALLRVVKLNGSKMIEIKVDGFNATVPMRHDYRFNENSFNMHILYMCLTNLHYFCSSVDTYQENNVVLNANETFDHFGEILTADFTGKTSKALLDYLEYYFTNPAAKRIS